MDAETLYTKDSSVLPKSYQWGISCIFVNANSGFGSFGTVLTCKTYDGGGGTLQLYAPYSSYYGGTRMKARFGNYSISQGNSWTTLKPIAWLEDVVPIKSTSTSTTLESSRIFYFVKETTTKAGVDTGY